MSTRTAVVVGGCGFVGRHVTAGLAALNTRVVSVHRSLPHDDAADAVACLSADYRDTDTMASLLENADILVHLGSASVPRTSVELGVTGVLNEVDANSRLFDVAARAGVARVVFASSGGSVYGECEPGRPIDENHSCQPISPHGLLKVMTELALSHISLVSGQSATSLRPGNIYGPGQKSRPRFGIVPTFLSNLQAGRSSEIWGADSVRDYVHIGDAARAFVAAATTEAHLPHAINVGTATGHSAVQVYSILQDIIGMRQPIEILAKPPSDPTWNVLSNEKLQRCLDVHPRIGLREGLTELVALDLESAR